MALEISSRFSEARTVILREQTWWTALAVTCVPNTETLDTRRLNGLLLGGVVVARRVIGSGRTTIKTTPGVVRFV